MTALILPPRPGKFHVFTARASADTGKIVDEAGSTKTYRKRLSHPKSKSGCLRCKIKRVKCDQYKPTCSRCSNRNAICQYPDERPQVVIRTLWPNDVNSTALRTSPGLGTPDKQLLQHYDLITCQDLTAPEVQSVFGAPMLPIAQEYSFLMHALLAISASHLQKRGSPCSSHKIALAFHWTQAARQFQAAIRSDISQANADATIITCVLLNMLSFSHIESDDPRSSWVFSSCSDRLSWLSLQMGLRPLLVMTRSFRKDTILTPMFLASDDDQRSFTNLSPGVEGMLQAFVELCDLNGSSTSANNVYHTPLRLLSATMKVQVIPSNLYLLVQFAGGIDDRFLSLLKANEHRALLIFSYWLGVLCRMPLWWCPGRARRDCTAICMYLDELCHNCRVRELLEWPAKACGYTMNCEPSGSKPHGTGHGVSLLLHTTGT